MAQSIRNITGGDLYLLVGPTRNPCRINSYFLLRESEWWRKELLGPDSSIDTPLKTGNKPGNPYHLKDESPHNFSIFLDVIYNNNYGNYSHITTNQWMVIHNYATKWGFKEMQGLAMRSLENQHMDIAERIVLYQRNKIPRKYILPYYITLATRPSGLELEECRTLGYKTIWFLHHARDDLFAKLLSLNSAQSLNDIGEVEIRKIVMAAYEKTIKDMDPTPGSSMVTEDQSKDPAGDAEDEDEGESLTGGWEDVDGDSDEKWENFSVPGSFS